MLKIHSQPTDSEPLVEPPPEVVLADGSLLPLDGMSTEELHELQWEQEPEFARVITALPKGSPQRAVATSQAYDTICTLLAAQRGESDEPLTMGFDHRYSRLVIALLHEQVSRGIGQPRLFEVGYGCGALLNQVRAHGFEVGGIEVSAGIRAQAVDLLGGRNADQLLLGDFRQVEPESLPGRPSVVFWNDVFEHIPEDEISEYLDQTYRLLVQGGSLVTITPNWLLRPSDVTGDFCPPRTEARGLHLKEYRLAEVSRLLRAAGFRRVATPLVVTKHRIVMLGGGLRWPKQLFEGLVDHLPVRWAHLACRGLGLSVTVATK